MKLHYCLRLLGKCHPSTETFSNSVFISEFSIKPTSTSGYGRWSDIIHACLLPLSFLFMQVVKVSDLMSLNFGPFLKMISLDVKLYDCCLTMQTGETSDLQQQKQYLTLLEKLVVLLNLLFVSVSCFSFISQWTCGKCRKDIGRHVNWFKSPVRQTSGYMVVVDESHM